MSRGLGHLQRAIAELLEQRPDGLAPADLVVEFSRAGLFPSDMSFEQVEQRLHAVRRACWSLRRRGIIHSASPAGTEGTMLGRSARSVWRHGGIDAVIDRCIAELAAAELAAEIAEREAELAEAELAEVRARTCA